MRTARLWGRLVTGLLGLLGVVVAMALQGSPDLPATNGSADRQLVLESMQVQALVLPNSDVSVRETIEARFEGRPWQGLLRAIPVLSRASGGTAHRLGLQLGAVTDAAGAPYRTESRLQDGERRLRIFIPNAAGTTRTAVIRYWVDQAIRFFPDHDEFYWNVTGNDRNVPIERASASILLPSGARGIRAVAYTGPIGSSRSDAAVSIEANEVRVATTRPLGWNEGLTVAVAFDKGSVREPGLWRRGLWWLTANWIVAMPLLTTLLMLGLWRHWGKDPQQRSIVVRYGPPEGLGPAEAGALIDDRVDGRDLMATLVDLAIRGYLNIERTSAGHWLMQPRYRFTLKRSQQDWPADLRPVEHALMVALFAATQAGDQVDSQELENEFYQHIPDLNQHVQKALIERRCFRRWPGQIRSIFATIAIGVLVVGAVLAGWLWGQFGIDTTLTTICFGLSAAAIMGIGWCMPRRTEQGARLLEEVRGYERFMARVDADRLDRGTSGAVEMTLESFERGLPYAMAFGLSRRWSQAFAAVLSVPPAWCAGGFGTSSLGDDLDRFASATSQAMASSPRSSAGSSGFGGGGGVGGGFGGGSVGGF